MLTISRFRMAVSSLIVPSDNSEITPEFPEGIPVLCVHGLSLYTGRHGGMSLADPMYEPHSIHVLDGALQVVWKDGHDTHLRPRYLRGNCGCAHCVDEITHRRRTGVQDVEETVRVEDVLRVGNYALAVLFSDLHATGIYPFVLLRNLCDCLDCKALRQAQR